MYRILLLTVFFAIVASLAGAFFFFMRGVSNRQHMVRMLFIRVALSVLLLVMIVYGYMNGHIP